MGPTQELAQKVCQRYGQSAVFDNEEEEGGRYWTCTVTMGYSGARRFVSEETSADQKQGTATASQAALLGLEEEIALEEAKPAKELAQLFPEKIDIYESNKTNWNYFWNHKPTIVGIDTEGNQISPPVLVQISTDDYTIIEVPSKGKGLSKNLSRLLSDETITSRPFAYMCLYNTL